MVTFSRVAPEVVEARHQAAAAKAQGATTPSPASLAANVIPALEIGDSTVIHFRGRPFSVPPVPWRVGEKLLAVRVAALEFADTLTSEAVPRYYHLLNELPVVIWANVRPVGWLRRLLRLVGVYRNPFEGATEAELIVLNDFLLQCRMRSTVILPGQPAPQA